MSATRVLLLVLIALGIIAIADGLKSGIGTLSMPGSGAWPFAVGVVFTLSVITSSRAKDTNIADRLHFGRVFYIPGAVLLFSLTYALGGLMTATAASAALASCAFPGRGQVWIMPAAGFVALSLWLALAYGMQMPMRLLPIGLGV